MTVIYQQIGLAIILGWIATACARPLGPAPRRAALGLAIGAAAVALFGWSVPVKAAMSLLAPLGTILPALAIRHMLKMSGTPVRPFAALDLMVILALLILFYCGSAGVLPFDAYRTGYGPWAAPILTAAFCVWGWLRDNAFPPLMALTGQCIWMAGIGSPNIFDHVTHALLVPIIALNLALRLGRAGTRRLRRTRSAA